VTTIHYKLSAQVRRERVKGDGEKERKEERREERRQESRTVFVAAGFNLC
jgi:hypothetical protein